MNVNFSRRGGIRALSLLLALVLALSASAIINGRRASALQNRSAVASQRALRELGEHLDAISTSLQKARYANSTAMLSRLGNELSRSASCAKVSLSALTNTGTDGTNLYKFLSQVGDFTLALNKTFERKGVLTEKQRAAMQALLSYAQSFSDALHALDSDYDAGSLRFDTQNATLTLAEKGAPEAFDDHLNSTAQALSDTPKLLYDGPFSDTVLNRKARAVASLDEISAQTARERAAKWLDCKQSELLAEGDTDGALALYCFSRGAKRIGVTKKGGLPAYVTNPDFSGEAQISAETAMKIAAKYLEHIGYSDMKPSYYSTYDGVCTVVFHYQKDDVVWYADLIKVGVALDTAQAVSFDARGYLMNHTVRKLPEVRLSPEEAAAVRSPLLRLLGSKLALIPLDDGTEQLCYELHCRDENGQEALVYVSAVTGEETDVQLLLYADGGVLAK